MDDDAKVIGFFSFIFFLLGLSVGLLVCDAKANQMEEEGKQRCFSLCEKWTKTKDDFLLCVNSCGKGEK